MDRYVAYDGPVQPITGLLELLEGLRMWVQWTSQDRNHSGAYMLPHYPAAIQCWLILWIEGCEVTVYDLVDALHLIQEMSIEQRNNPLWFDARQ